MVDALGVNNQIEESSVSVYELGLVSVMNFIYSLEVVLNI